MICNRIDRDVTPATVHGAPAVAVQHEQPQEPLRGGRPPQTVTASFALRVRSRRLMVSFMDLLWVNLFTNLTFVSWILQSVCASAEVDEASSSTRSLRAAASVSRRP